MISQGLLPWLVPASPRRPLVVALATYTIFAPLCGAILTIPARDSHLVGMLAILGPWWTAGLPLLPVAGEERRGAALRIGCFLLAAGLGHAFGVFGEAHPLIGASAVLRRGPIRDGVSGILFGAGVHGVLVLSLWLARSSGRRRAVLIASVVALTAWVVGCIRAGGSGWSQGRSAIVIWSLLLLPLPFICTLPRRATALPGTAPAVR